MDPEFSFVEWKNGNAVLRGSCHIAGRPTTPWVIFCHGFTGHRSARTIFLSSCRGALPTKAFHRCGLILPAAGESDGLFPDMNISTMQADLHSAVSFVKTHYQPSRLILLGHSFGGLVTALCAAESAAHGLILLSPVANPTGMAKRRAELIKAGPNADGLYENGPHEMSMTFLDTLQRIDPIAALDSGFKGKLLLIQGNADVSISPEESKRYCSWAQKAGIENSCHLLEQADHNYSTVSHVKTLCQITGTWLKERFL